MTKEEFIYEWIGDVEDENIEALHNDIDSLIHPLPPREDAEYEVHRRKGTMAKDNVYWIWMDCYDWIIKNQLKPNNP